MAIILPVEIEMEIEKKLRLEENLYHIKDDINYKYQEDRILKEIEEYVNKTYDSHYSKSNIQSTEVIIDAGYGKEFCLGNLLKYTQRYGKKGLPQDWRKDIMKVIHYAIILLYVHDQENKEAI